MDRISLLKQQFTSASNPNASSKDAYSYISGPSDTPLIGKCIGEFLRDQATKFPNNDCLVACHQNVRMTYQEFDQKVDQMAMAFIRLGLEAGDRIGLYSPNCYEWAIVQFAASRADLVLVNVNPAYQAGELDYALKKVEVKVLVTAREFKKSHYVNIIKSLVPEISTSPNPYNLELEGLPTLKAVIRLDDQREDGFLYFADMWNFGTDHERSQLAIREKYADIDNASNIQFTSGTTGNPKGATLSHHNILNNAFSFGQLLHYTDRDRVCIAVPLYHCMGMVLGNMACIAHGATMVYPNDAFDAALCLDAIQNEQCTSIIGVPTMFSEIVKEQKENERNITALRTGLMSGTVCPKVLIQQVVKHLGAKELAICYGMTETSPVSVQTKIGDSLDVISQYAGVAYPHVEMKIVDERGQIVPRGQVGQVCVRGYHVMMKYWDDEKNTAKTIDRNGWLKSGDLGVIDPNGYCKIVGRIKDMVIRGGENIYPKEIEEFLRKHDNIIDAQLVGVPDEKFGEEVCAWIIKRDPTKGPMHAGDIKEYCQGRIAHYKIPKFAKFVDSYPLTVSGKVKKFILKKYASREFGQASPAL